MSDDYNDVEDDDFSDFTGDKAIDDPKLMFIIQLKIINSIDEEKFEKTLRLVYMFDRYLAPYWGRWPSGKGIIGYEDRKKKLTEEFRTAAVTGLYKGDAIDDEKLMRLKAEELFELERRLMQEAQLLPAPRASAHGGSRGA